MWILWYCFSDHQCAKDFLLGDSLIILCVPVNQRMGDSSDVVEMEVFRWLPQVDVVKLEEVCGTLNVTIPEERKGNKSLLLKLILRTLNSEQFEALDDSGLSLFLEIHGILV